MEINNFRKTRDFICSCPNSALITDGQAAHVHFDERRGVFMLCAHHLETGHCLWCVAIDMELDLEPIYQSYHNIICYDLNFRASWQKTIQRHFSDILAPVNVKPAKSTPRS